MGNILHFSTLAVIVDVHVKQPLLTVDVIIGRDEEQNVVDSKNVLLRLSLIVLPCSSSYVKYEIQSPPHSIPLTVTV